MPTRPRAARAAARHRVPLLAIGVICGYLGAAPSLIWAFGVMALPMMPLLLPVYVWLYTLVEVLASLWFAHYACWPRWPISGASAPRSAGRRRRRRVRGTRPAVFDLSVLHDSPHSPHLLP
ncbi:MAG: hypothetical protein U1F21_08165 [Sphaerotilus natans]